MDLNESIIQDLSKKLDLDISDIRKKLSEIKPIIQKYNIDIGKIIKYTFSKEALKELIKMKRQNEITASNIEKRILFSGIFLILFLLSGSLTMFGIIGMSSGIVITSVIEIMKNGTTDITVLLPLISSGISSIGLVISKNA